MNRRLHAVLWRGKKIQVFLPFFLCVVLVVMVWFVFGQTLIFEFVNLDDPQYVTDNSLVQSGITVDGVVRALTRSDYSFYHPLTTLSHMLDFQLYGLTPAGFHLTNVFLHTLSAVILFLVLRSMTGSLWRSVVVAVIFAIHPLRAESVAWVTERKDMLSGLFFMLTLAAYTGYVRSRFSFRRYGLVFLCAAGSMLSKATVLTLPFVLLLLDYWPLERLEKRGGGKLLLEKVPLFLLSAGMAVVMMRTSGESLHSFEASPFSLRLSNAIVSYAVYMLQSVYFARLAVLYPYPLEPLSLWRIASAAAVLVAVTSVVVKSGRDRKYLLTGWLWFVGMLVPMIGIIQAGQQAHADRYTYLSQIGLSLALVWIVGEWAARKQIRCRAVSLLAVAGVLALTGAARVQTSFWRDSVSLFEHALACTEKNFIVHDILGTAFIDCGGLDQAQVHYQEALRINPAFYRAHYNAGNAYALAGEFKKAIEHYRRAVELNPALFNAHYNLGVMLARTGCVAEGVEHLRQVVKLRPGFARGHQKLAELCRVLEEQQAPQLSR